MQTSGRRLFQAQGTASAKGKGTCARVFEEEEAGCDGWSRRSDGEVAR